MKKTSALLTVLWFLFLLSVETAAGHAVRSALVLDPSGSVRVKAPPQAASSARWQSREEYDAFNAMTSATDPDRKIALAEAFFQKFPESDFRSEAYLAEMHCYFQQNKVDQAITAARKALRFDRNNLDALSFLSYVFPFTFHLESPSARADLAAADSDARRGLFALQALQPPANATPHKFRAYVASKRSTFNNAIGFVALQQKDYPAAITAFRATVADNPDDVYTFYRMGLAYLSSTPTDYHHGIWYVARAAGLARASKNPAYADLSHFLRNVFVQAYGNSAGMEGTITMAGANVNPPDGLDGPVGSRRPPQPRGGIGPAPAGTASASYKPNPSGAPASGQTSYVTINQEYPPIYPTWLPPSENESADQALLPLPAQPNDQFVSPLFFYPGGEMSMAGQEQPGPYASAPIPPEPPEPEPAPPPTVLVYKDGHQVEVQDYAIMGQNLVWISGQLSKKIPLAELNLPATRKVNEDHGVTFGTERAP